MVTTVSILGSCVTRDLFNSKVIPDYKDFFKLITYQGRASIISMMQPPLEFNSNDVFTGDTIDSNFIKSDLRKDGINGLIKNPPEFLIIDILFDVIFGILYCEDGTIISNNTWSLHKTIFYNKLHGKYKILTIQDNTTDYFSLFKYHVNKLFNFLEINCPNTKVILNSVRHSYAYLKDGNIVSDENFKKYGFNNNNYFEKLENYIIDNFEVDIMYFGQNYLADSNHMWGLAPHHYEKRYYNDKFNQLKNIVNNQKILHENFLLSHQLSDFKKKNKILLRKNKILSDEKRFFKTQNRCYEKENIFKK